MRAGLSGRARGTAIRVALITCLVAATGMPTVAKDMKLGGQQNQHPEAPPPVKLPLNFVELPPMLAAMQEADGRWRHVRIDAWLDADDEFTGRMLDNLKKAIAKRVSDELADVGYDALHSPRDGSEVAKKTIRKVAEETLGHSWKGTVRIRAMLVY